MPKDETDPEDPLELRGVALLTEEDTSDAMTECFVEEFLRLGLGPEQILALFRNPHYTGPHLVHRSRGDDYVRTRIAEVFGWWGRPVTLKEPEPPGADGAARPADAGLPGDVPPAAQILEFEPGLSDPGGAAVPRLQL